MGGGSREAKPGAWGRASGSPGHMRQWQWDSGCILKAGANRICWWLRWGYKKRRRVSDISMDLAWVTRR